MQSNLPHPLSITVISKPEGTSMIPPFFKLITFPTGFRDPIDRQKLTAILDGKTELLYWRWYSVFMYSIPRSLNWFDLNWFVSMFHKQTYIVKKGVDLLKTLPLPMPRDVVRKRAAEGQWQCSEDRRHTNGSSPARQWCPAHTSRSPLSRGNKTVWWKMYCNR